ncbi:Rha family transcriptional regulator [Lysinibacillus sp. FSL R7-0073]|uniref:Rha family transcriptional regulator n=1 Tax=Lysinibacillus sp. FSL R7-0073 TaxID=2921669 RepID=UPI0030FB2610
MKDLVFVENNEVVTDSLVIAEMFGKDHNKVVRDIENQISKLKEAGEEKWGVANFGDTQYQHPQNKQLYPKYNLTEDGFAIVAMSYTTPEAMKMKVKFIQEFKRMKKYIQQQVKQPGDNVIEFEKQLIGVKYTSEILRVDESSKIKMLEAAHTQHGVPTNHLPVYVESEELKKPISELLKEYNVGISAIKANKILLTVGILEIKYRPSSKGGTKEFKSVTDKGKYYGLNAISPQNPKETQPLYYPSKFSELIPLLTGQEVS